jgi:hypothetical protein
MFNFLPIFVMASTNETALVDDLQRRAVMYFVEQTHPKTGLTKDRAANFKDSDTYTVASSAATGFALVANVIGTERKWLNREESRKRTLITLKGINDSLSHERGWGYHFTNWATGERVWKCESSSIDTAILLAGVLAVRNYWKDPEVSQLSKKYLDRIDWKWMLTDGGEKPNETLFSMGWHPAEDGKPAKFIDARWGLKTYDEFKLLYVMAYGATDLPVTGWDRIAREHHTYEGIEFITGGPLFMHQMSEGFFDFKNKRDGLGYDYWVASRNAARANRAYCIANPKGMRGYGPRMWGLSACDWKGGYDAFGAPGWINDNGTITPTAAIAAMPWLPKEATAVAVDMKADYPSSYGRYGFPNGMCPQMGWTGPDVIGIDLGMMLLNVENARTGLIHKLTNADPVVKRGFARIGFKKSVSNDKAPLKLKK